MTVHTIGETVEYVQSDVSEFHYFIFYHSNLAIVKQYLAVLMGSSFSQPKRKLERDSVILSVNSSVNEVTLRRMDFQPSDSD